MKAVAENYVRTEIMKYKWKAICTNHNLEVELDLRVNKYCLFLPLGKLPITGRRSKKFVSMCQCLYIGNAYR